MHFSRHFIHLIAHSLQSFNKIDDRCVVYFAAFLAQILPIPDFKSMMTMISELNCTFPNISFSRETDELHIAAEKNRQ